MSRDPLVKVYESQGAFAAEVVKAKLEANNIPAMLKFESVGRVLGLTVDGLGRVEVHVPVEFEDEARSLIDVGDEESEADLDDGDQENDATG